MTRGDVKGWVCSLCVCVVSKGIWVQGSTEALLTKIKKQTLQPPSFNLRNEGRQTWKMTRRALFGCPYQFGHPLSGVVGVDLASVD